MSTTALIVIVAVIVIAAIAVWVFVQNRRTQALKGRFGPEYDRTVRELGNRSRAESELSKRAERIERYHLHPLTREQRDRFLEDWKQTQAHFVDDPAMSIREADRLVEEVMKARGYPVADFERRAEDISVNHPHVVRNYRAAHTIALSHREGKASTEDLRNAMVSYRDLFDELLEVNTAGRMEVHR